MWKSEGGNDVAYKTWPGVKMTSARGNNLFECEVPAEYNCCLFVDGTNTNDKTDDLRNIPYTNAKYSGGSWIEVQGATTQPTDPTSALTQPTSAHPAHRSHLQPDTVDKVLGYANLDGNITIKDVTQIQRHFAELIALSGNAYTAADVDKSGRVAIKDATYVQMFLAEMDNHAYVNTYVNVGGNDPTRSLHSPPTRPSPLFPPIIPPAPEPSTLTRRVTTPLLLTSMFGRRAQSKAQQAGRESP